MKSVLCMAICASACMPVQIGFAAGNEASPNWPCVQRRVPTISAATMWTEPPLMAERENEWRSDREMSRLVKRLALRRVSIEEAAKMIEDFTKPLSDEEKLEKMPLVFQGLLQTVNKERLAIIKGIERYTIKQRDLADQIRESRLELEEVLANSQNEAARDEAQKALDWQTRIHKDREKSLEYVCESPTLLEQRMFNLARELQYQLP